VADAQCTRKLEDGYDRRIASTAFKITDVLLGKAGQFGELLLREALMLPQSCEIPTDQLAHVHARDASWFQWPLLEAAVEGNIVADFPLCNKSFNCSYSGHDL